MDLGIAGRTALVCASSRRLGFACAQALAHEGVHVIINGRDPERLAIAETSLRNVARGSILSVCADLTTRDDREALLSVAPDPDILINNNAGPEPKDFSRSRTTTGRGLWRRR